MNVSFNALLIRLKDKAYPKTLGDVRAENPLCSFAAEPSEEIVASLGYRVVQPTPKPTLTIAQKAVEGQPVLVNGLWTQVWSVADLSSDEQEAQLSVYKADYARQVDALRDAAFEAGFKYDFGGDYGQLTVQQRDVDKLNITGVRTIADAFIRAGQPDTSITFRTAENINVQMTATEFVTLSNASFQFVTQVNAASWSLKDQVANAATLAALPVIPAKLLN